jgi:hypothetical protein
MDGIPSTAAASAVVVVIVIVLWTVSFMSTHTVFAGSYEKTQSASQTNECGNYWFPINVLCSNINPQSQGDKSSVAVTSAQEDGNAESTENLGTPFP